MLQDLSLLRKTDYLAWKIWFKKNLVFKTSKVSDIAQYLSTKVKIKPSKDLGKLTVTGHI